MPASCTRSIRAAHRFGGLRWRSTTAAPCTRSPSTNASRRRRARDIAPLDNVSPPMTGDLDAESLRALCEILARHTAVADRCWFAVWEGWGDWGSGSAVTFSRRGRDPAPSPPPAPAEWQLDLTGPTFALPDRTYHLFAGPVDAALRIGHWSTRDWFIPRPPNLFWPDDRAWCVASEIDFDSTLIGGPARLVDDILEHEAFEAWPVEPSDSLAFDGDTVNRR